jgi:hypothetical protein
MQNRGKETLLLVLALVALGVALFTFRGKHTPTAPPAKPTAQQEQVQTEVARAAPGQGATEQAPGGEGEATAAGATGGASRNPFAAPHAPTAVPGPADAAGAVEDEGHAPPTAEPAPVPDKALTLTGIVEGKPAVAIIRQEDQRYFVRVGDQVGEQYRVKAIGRQEVALVGPEGKVILRMGGRQ